MTGFEDGPAKGKWLELQRLPLFLRVAIDSKGGVDALDQLDDEPHAEERFFVYRRVGAVGTIHIDYVDKVTRRRCGKWMQSARYRLYLEQPEDGIMRDRLRWQAWCQAAYARAKGE